MRTSKRRKKKYVDFDDTNVALGKRKVEFVKWLMKTKHYSKSEAKLACYKKFYREEHE